jgi:hypothetical protein
VDSKVVLAVAGGGGVGVAAIVGYAAVFPHSAAAGRPSFLSVLFVGVACALAAAALGAAVGFLFGIPRTLRAEPDAQRSGYAANTSLEEISDWLTKIIIGVTLVQIGAAVDGLGRLFSALGPSFGGRPDSSAFAAALLIYFSVLGFGGSWLSTRLYLATALSDVDRLLEEAAAADRAGDPERAAQLRRAAFALTEAGKQYEDLRATPSGPARTQQLEEVVQSVRAHAAQTGPPVNDIRSMFARGGDGDRVAALAMMQGNPDAVDVDILREAITDSRSAFEQYHALIAAENWAERDKGKPATADSQTLAAHIHEALEGARSHLLDEERRQLAEEVLAALESRTG